MVETVTALKAIGLSFSKDIEKGILRKKSGRHFSYYTGSGKKITNPSVLKRIGALVLPPAWKNVWICLSAKGHLQATGRDARGRKQYRYHPDYRSHRDETKFHRMIEFAQALPGLRRKIERDLDLPGLAREKVLATVVRLLESTLIRVGNEEYARSNKSYGLSTLKDQHVKKIHDGIRFSFIGKSGVDHQVEVSDHRICKIVLHCQDIPGQQLFQYLSADKKRHTVTSGDVNAYIREISGDDFSAKDFRTWRGTVLAATAFERMGEATSLTQAKKQIASVVKDVAAELRNRPATCRKYYIHPKVLEQYSSLKFQPLFAKAKRLASRHPIEKLSRDEQRILQLLKTG